jgi:hypothetical protein
MTLKPGVWLLFCPLHLAAERVISFSDWVHAEKALVCRIYNFKNSAFCKQLVYSCPKQWMEPISKGNSMVSALEERALASP